MTRFVRPAAGLSAAAFAVLLAGCAPKGPQFCEVKGTVLYQGKPLTGGLVQITDEANTQSAAEYMTIDGEFRMSRAPAGPVRVVVQTDAVKHLLDEKTAAMLNKKGVAAVSVDPKVKGNKYVKIPAKYADRGTTDVKMELKPNTANEITVELK